MQRVRISSRLSIIHKLGDTRTTLSPKFTVETSSSSSSSSLSSSSSIITEQIIPGLPDDIAILCLLRLPIAVLPTCRAVCRWWHRLLGGEDTFFTLRRSLGLCEPYLFVLTSHRCTRRSQWLALHLASLSWHFLPITPTRHRPCCIAVPSAAALLVCGGYLSDVDSPLPSVLKFDVLTNKWSSAKRMISPRSFFAGGEIDGTIYVAGGYGDDNFELDSAEAFDPEQGIWREVAKMGSCFASYDFAVVDEKLLVTEGWAWPFQFSPRGQVYDPRSNTWCAMPAGMSEGWTGPSFVVDGKLFVISENEEMKIKVYNEESDCWEAVEGSPLPERIRKPVTVSSIGLRIFAVGQGLHVAVGDVERKKGEGDSSKWFFTVGWEDAFAPPEFSDLLPASAHILFA